MTLALGSHLCACTNRPDIYNGVDNLQSIRDLPLEYVWFMPARFCLPLSIRVLYATDFCVAFLVMTRGIDDVPAYDACRNVANVVL